VKENIKLEKINKKDDLSQLEYTYQTREPQDTLVENILKRIMKPNFQINTMSAGEIEKQLI
jgi:hypothetical protein